MTDIRVRAAVAADQDAVGWIHRLAFAPMREIYRPGPRAHSATQQTGSIVRLVAEIDGRILATACYERTPDLLELFSFACDPAHQRQGLACALLRHIETIARQASIRRLRAVVVAETGNAAIYERLGFTSVATSPSMIFTSNRFPVIHETVMEKQLEAP